MELVRGREDSPVLERVEPIQLPCYGIVVELTGDGGGSITSEMHDKPNYDECSNKADRQEEYESTLRYNGAIDGIESMVLAHAMAGIDITTPAYIEGIETAEQGAGNNC